mgnify:CR=1 FL=1
MNFIKAIVIIKEDKLLAVIDDTDKGKIEMAKAKNEIIKEAEVEIKYFTASEEAQYLEDMKDLWESDRASELGYAKRERKKRTVRLKAQRRKAYKWQKNF